VSEDEDEEEEVILYGADPECDHEIVEVWSGIKCAFCKGWFCY
jgi:hypothetical protein